eukprot:TRINITY_DN9016_c0_g1_i1.p1 TRINITY_DN9016_c0_g1~~TRINITY_DN9016_c0_g1_i1.p1  ORF type:complete len:216 (-),score=54.81 TRINITY_DN9016_c0_g1_i1:157-741(-)
MLRSLVGSEMCIRDRSSILNRYTSQEFRCNHESTVGIDLRVKTVQVGGDKVRLQIWDTAGQDRFRSITQAYYRGAMGILVVYDATDRRSFRGIEYWMRSIAEHGNTKAVVFLVGNKVDMTNKLAVGEEEARRLADGHRVEWRETSAQANIGIQEVFADLAQSVYDKQQIESCVGTETVGLESDLDQARRCCVIS